MISCFPLTAFVVLAMLLLSCSTDPGLDEHDATWKFHGLDSAAVYSIHERNGKLYAGTNQGVYISTDPERTSWRSPKLDIEGIQYISLAMGNDQKIIAAVHYQPDYFKEENKVIFESTDDGESWGAINATIEGAERYGRPVSTLISLNYIEYQTSNLKVLYGYNGVISHSTDGGQNWEVVYDEGGESEFLEVSDHHPNHIWTGGRMPLPIPYLATSEDGGETWTMLNEQISFNTHATASAVAISPRDPDVVLVGFVSNGPAIRKTEDGGQTWTTVLEEYRVYAMGNSKVSLNRVYASGNHPSSKPTVVVSDNYGDSWTTFIHEEGAERLWVNDMAVAGIDGQEVVFLGTEKGVYSFRLSD